MLSSKFTNMFINNCLFWLPWIFVATFRLFLVLANRDCSLVVVLGLLIAVGSIAAEHGL